MMRKNKSVSKFKSRLYFLIKITVIVSLLFCSYIIYSINNPKSYLYIEHNPFSNIFKTNTSYNIDLVSEYAYLKKVGDNKVIFEKNKNVRVAQASTTKIMSTVVALEMIEDLDALAPIDYDAYMEMVNNNSSMAGFYANETTTYRDLLYATMLNSGGEAVMSLAVNISGNEEDFVQLMNEKAKQLNLSNTNYKNVTGLDAEDHYSTVEDTAKLLEYALSNKDFRDISSTKSYQSSSTNHHPDGILLQSTVLNLVVDNSEENYEIIGGKSGTTKKAGQCWATYGIINNELYIAITFNAPFDDNFSHVSDTNKLYELASLSEQK